MTTTRMWQIAAGLVLGTTLLCAASDANAGTCGTVYYLDSDKDGYGTSATTKTACSQPSGYVTKNTDCNDKNKAIKPGATEVCDGVDNDCDKSVDEGVIKTYYRDEDADAYGLSTVTVQGCTAPAGHTVKSTDCNDKNATIHPDAAEVCNGVDEDCDGQTDEGKTTSFYRDADGDAFGTSTSSKQACSAPSGYVAAKTDCNDANPAINPGAAEVCDGLDNDCDASTDEGVKKTFYPDVDSDGYGQTSLSTQACSLPTGYVTLGGDCNDDEGTMHPGGAERCNGADDDCDGQVDEDLMTYYADRDGDTYGNEAESSRYGCNATLPSGLVRSAGDCNDLDARIHPMVADVADHIDNDCDGVVDGTTDVCRFLGSCGGRDIIVCDLGNPKDTGVDAYFADLVDTCSDHAAVPLVIASEGDDRCIGDLLGPWDEDHGFAIGLNRIAPQSWHWEGSSLPLGGGYTGETVVDSDQGWTPWEPEYAAAGETVMTINFDPGWGGHPAFNWWGTIQDAPDVQRILCER